MPALPHQGVDPARLCSEDQLQARALYQQLLKRTGDPAQAECFTANTTSSVRFTPKIRDPSEKRPKLQQRNSGDDVPGSGVQAGSGAKQGTGSGAGLKGKENAGEKQGSSAAGGGGGAAAAGSGAPAAAGATAAAATDAPPAAAAAAAGSGAAAANKVQQQQGAAGSGAAGQKGQKGSGKGTGQQGKGSLANMWKKMPAKAAQASVKEQVRNGPAKELSCS